ncbi:LysR family transcriptional regulator [Photorhabdus bodei]|uniref:LysR family transcriptional regulator n=1 Tax=Photorhabdus bodei TaxID=2029681 RepID=UPI001E34FECC|nr:LysR family transcriptional regulator [Photorhabdus bodei]MCC8463083.1 LysR family transcriptional regulator [Photorhabdus bodei]
MNIDLNLLRVFIMVATQGNFARASEQLSMPTSNVSRGIKQLEEQINCRLIERTTRRMRLTEQGLILLQRSTKLYAELDETINQITHSDLLSGTLRMTIPSEVGSELLAGIIAQFALQHPKISIHCDTQLMSLDVISDDIDLLLTFHRGELENSSYHSRLIKSWKSVVVASPKLLEQTGRPDTLDQLTHMPCISSLNAIKGQPWVFIDQDGHQKRININSHFRVNSGSLAKTAAEKGVGFAILSLDTCLEEIRQGKLQIITFAEQPAPLELRAIYASRSSLSPKIGAFLNHLFACLNLTFT